MVAVLALVSSAVTPAQAGEPSAEPGTSQGSGGSDDGDAAGGNGGAGGSDDGDTGTDGVGTGDAGDGEGDAAAGGAAEPETVPITMMNEPLDESLDEPLIQPLMTPFGAGLPDTAVPIPATDRFELSSPYVPASPFNFSDNTLLFDNLVLPPEWEDWVDRDTGEPVHSVLPADRVPTRDLIIGSVVAADLNIDGFDDLAYSVWSKAPGYNGAYDHRYVIIQLSDGIGGFNDPVAYYLGNNAVYDFAITVGDTNGDTYPDIVVTMGGQRTIRTMFGDGTGEFTAYVQQTTVDRPHRNAILADLNGDGTLDLVTSDYYEDAKVSIYLGNGDGTFRAEGSLTVDRVRNVLVIDSDHQGRPEIITLRQYGPSQLWRWTDCGNDCDAAGGWAEVPNVFPASGGSSLGWVGDFNGDGFTDFVAEDWGCSSNRACVTPYQNNGDGTFSAKAKVASPPYDSNNANLQGDYSGPINRMDGKVYDVDGDGNNDLLLPGYDGTIGVLYGNGDFTFTDTYVTGRARTEPRMDGGWDADSAWGWGASSYTTAIVAGNFTADYPYAPSDPGAHGQLDLVTVGTPGGKNAGQVTLVAAQGPRSYPGATLDAKGGDKSWVSYDSVGMQLIDWDGDKHDDLFYVAPDTDSFWLARGTGSGFGTPTKIGAYGGGYSTNYCDPITGRGSLTIADINGDGYLDVMCGDSRIFVFFGQEGGSLGPATSPAGGNWTDTANKAGVRVLGAALTDVDGDGRLDYLYATWAGVDGATGETGDALSVRWLKNLGYDDTAGRLMFAPSQRVSGGQLATSDGVKVHQSEGAVAVADFNGDGLADVAVDVRYGSIEKLRVMLNTGTYDSDGSPIFESEEYDVAQFAGGQQADYWRVQALDVDGDGDLDLYSSNQIVVSGGRGERPQILFNNGDGAFSQGQVFTGDGTRMQRVVADLNGDGIPDLIEPTLWRGVQLRAGLADANGQATGTFGPPQLFPTGDETNLWVGVTDVDGDGATDVVAYVNQFNFVGDYRVVVMHNEGGSSSGSGSDPNATLNLKAAGLEWTPASSSPAGTGTDPLTGITSGTVTVTVKNTSAGKIKAPWMDTVWLSDDATYSADDTLVARLDRTSPLPAGGQLSDTADVTITPHKSGTQYLLLRADTRGQISETDEGDNIIAIPLTVAIPELTLPDDTTSPATTVTGGSLPTLLAIPAFSGYVVQLDATGGLTELAVRAGSVPTSVVADARLTAAGELLLQPGGTRYLMVSAGSSVTITLSRLAFGVATVSPRTAAPQGISTFILRGVGLDQVTAVTAQPAESIDPPLVAGTIEHGDDGSLTVTFDLTDAPPGLYDIEVADGAGATATAPGAFTVVTGPPGRVVVSVLASGIVFRDNEVSVKIFYSNTGMSDAVAPIFTLRTMGVSTVPVRTFFPVTQIRGKLRPGESGTISFSYTVANGMGNGLPGDVTVPVSALAGFQVDVYQARADRPFNAAAEFATELAAQPAVDREALTDILTARLGTTMEGWVRGMNELGKDNPDAGKVDGDLLTPLHAAAWADALAALPPRSAEGTFGVGQTKPGTLTFRYGASGQQQIDPIAETGEWALRGIDDGTDVTVSSDGYGPGPFTHFSADGQTLNLDAAAAVWKPLTGRLTGTGAAGALVTITDPDTGDAVTAVADAQGRYAFAGVKPGEWTLVATSASSGRVTSGAVTMGTAPQTFDLALTAETAVTVVVTSAGSAAPVAGATVTVTQDATGDMASGTSDASGQARITGLVAGPVTVSARADGYLPASVTQTAPGSSTWPVALTPALTLTGVVKDAGGNTLEGAQVSVGGDAAATADDGRYAISVPAGETVEVTARADGYLPQAHTITATSGPLAPADFTLANAASLKVTVTDPDSHAAVPEVLVALTDEPTTQVLTARSGADGVAEFVDIAPGDFTLYVGDLAGTGTDVTLTAGNVATQSATARLTAVTGALPVIHDVADDGHGAAITRPAAGVQVLIDRGDDIWDSVTTDEHGAFTVTGVAGASSQLWVVDPYLGVLHTTAALPASGTAALPTWARGGGDLTVSLPWMDQAHAPLLTLRHVDSGAQTLLVPDSNAISAADRIVVGNDKSLNLKGLPTGNYELTVRRSSGAAGAPAGAVEDVTVSFAMNAADTAVTVNETEFPAFVTASGTATSGGAALAGALVILDGTSGAAVGHSYSATTAANGAWTVWVAAGAYSVAAIDPATGHVIELAPIGAPGPLRAPGRAFVGLAPNAVVGAAPASVGIAPRSIEDILDKNLWSRAVGDFANWVLSMPLPVKSRMEEAIFDYYDLDDIQLNAFIELVLAYPYPEDKCTIYEFPELVIAKAKASRAKEAWTAAQEAMELGRKDLRLHSAEFALAAVKIINDVRKVFYDIPGFDDADTFMSGGKKVITAKSAIGWQLDIVSDLSTNAAKLAQAAAAFEDSVGKLKGAYDAVWTVSDMITNWKYEGWYDALGKFMTTVGMTLDAAELYMDVIGKQSAVFKQRKGVFGRIAAAKDAFDGVVERYNQFKLFDQMMTWAKDTIKQKQDEYTGSFEDVFRAWKEFQRVGIKARPKPGCNPEDVKEVQPVGPYFAFRYVPHDPNEIVGPTGAGSDQWVRADATLPYEIEFENIGPGSQYVPDGVDPDTTAPAQQVTVSLPLDPDIDVDTVTLGEFGFGAKGFNQVLFKPGPGAQTFSDQQDFAITVPSEFPNQPDENLTLKLKAQAWIDRSASPATVEWRIELIDPDTGTAHRNPFAGFLPPEPEEHPGAGRGFVTLSAQPHAAVSTGTEVTAKASIVFDQNPAIDTNTWSNKLDGTAPVGSASGGSTTPANGTITVGATDAGAGVKYVDVWRSVDGGPLQLWKQKTPPGPIPVEASVGQTLGFAAQATDLVYLAEQQPPAPQFTTTITEPIDTGDHNSGGGDHDTGGSGGSGSGAAGAGGATGPEGVRLAGSNRYGTAAAIAARFGPANAVVLANGEDRLDGADALAANYLAGKVIGPIILTQASRLPTESAAAIAQVLKGAPNPTIYVMGGTSSVSDATAAAAKAAAGKVATGTVTIVRVAGADRFGTSAKAATAVGAVNNSIGLGAAGARAKTAIVASGLVNADALAAGALSYAWGMPVLLTAAGGLSDAVLAVIKGQKITQLVILGGTDRVSQAVIDQARTAGVTTVKRIAGPNRFATSAELYAWALGQAVGSDGKPYGNAAGAGVMVANGYVGFPDALAAGPLAGKTGGIMLTTTAAALPDQVGTFLGKHKAKLGEVTGLGGPATIAEAVLQSAGGRLR